MGIDDKNSGKPTPITPTGRQMVSELARRSGAVLNTVRPPLGAMCQQGQDWSRSTACFPQKLVHLVGYRDPDSRPSSPLSRRPVAAAKNHMPSDTPIG